MVEKKVSVELLEGGCLQLDIGGKARELQFKTQELVLLEKRLEKSVLMFLGSSGSQVVFLQEAIFAGLSRKERGVSPTRISGWLDDYRGDKEELMVKILYSIARAQPGEDGKRLVQVLDESFGHWSNKVPSESASEKITSETNS